MRRSLLLMASSLVLAGFSAGATADMYTFSAVLDGAQAGHPESTGTGAGTFEIDTDLNTVSYTITYEDLLGTEFAAHIHAQPVFGLPAGIVHPLPNGTPKVGAWNYPESEEARILGGYTYVNIHTDLYAGGEIAGAITPEPATLCLLVAGGAAAVLRRRRR